MTKSQRMLYVTRFGLAQLRLFVSFDVPSDLGAFHAKQIIAIARAHAIEVELK